MAKKNNKNFSLNGIDDKMWGWVFISPFLIGILLVFIKVLTLSVRFAISDVSMGNGLSFTFVGLKNFHYAFRVDADFLKLLWSDLQELITTLPVVLIFSMFVAVVLNSDIWGRTVFRAIFFLPVIVCTGLISKMDASSTLLTYMNSAAVASESDGIASAMGDISLFLQNLQLNPELISIVSTAANNIFEIVNRSGVQILIFIAGIQSVSPQLYEAARIDGASAWVIFWKITLPMMVPMMIVNLIYTFVECLTKDDTALLTHIRTISFTKGEFGYASAMAWINCLSIALIMIIVFIVIGIGKKINKKSKEEEYR